MAEMPGAGLLVLTECTNKSPLNRGPTTLFYAIARQVDRQNNLSSGTTEYIESIDWESRNHLLRSSLSDIRAPSLQVLPHLVKNLLFILLRKMQLARQVFAYLICTDFLIEPIEVKTGEATGGDFIISKSNHCRVFLLKLLAAEDVSVDA